MVDSPPVSLMAGTETPGGAMDNDVLCKLPNATSPHPNTARANGLHEVFMVENVPTTKPSQIGHKVLDTP